MTNARSFILKALFPLGAMLALAACIDPVIIGGNGNGGSGSTGGGVACMTDSNCAPGQACVNGVCAGPATMDCNGMPSPLSCTETGCAAGQICVMDPDPNACYPSSCGCDPATGGWICTADCGQGSHCVPAQQCGPNGGCPPGTACDATGMCVPACMNAPETCNNVDDDCDGVIDEQDDPAFPLCSNGAVCVMGQCGGTAICMTDAECGPNRLCIGGQCVGSVPCASDMDCPSMQQCINGVCGGANCSMETCNGVDDDCNGAVDDGAGAVCADGTLCVNGNCGGNPQQCGPNSPCPPGQVCSAMGVCTPGNCMPKTEVCNNVDDDCDGAIDEVVPGTTLCPNGGTCIMGQCNSNPQQCGPMVPCPAGQMCTANGVCTPGGCMPTPETCNGVDDDCDGVVDEATAGATLCPNGGSCVMGQCSGTTQQCGPNVPCPAGQVCSANGVCTMGGCMPTPEVCNNIDDDCDGAIDEATAGTTLCSNGGTCIMGQCSVVQCSPNNPCPVGQMCTPNGVCSPGGCTPTAEVCNGLDDDCDGVVDDATAGTTLCTNGICQGGQCHAVCQSNNQCPAGQLCMNGVCN